MKIIASSRRSVSQGAARKTARGKIKKKKCGDRKCKNACGQTRGRSSIPRSGIPSDCMVNFDRFCQHSSITDAYGICDMAVVRDLSMSDVVFKSVINNKLKDFPK